jgi:hypothetical protein
MPDIVAIPFDKPDRDVWTARNGAWAALGCWQGELADRACQRDAPNLAVLNSGTRIGKPEGTIRSLRDFIRPTRVGDQTARWQWDFVDRALELLGGSGGRGRPIPSVLPCASQGL